MQSGKAEVYEVGGHIVKDQKQMRTSSTWISHTRSVHMKRYSPD